MGINVVVGCRTHRERVWIYRGHEHLGCLDFVSRHPRCPLVISHDQSDEGWIDDDGWSESTYDSDPSDPNPTLSGRLTA